MLQVKHMKRIKKALKNGRRVHYEVSVIDAWSGGPMWQEGYENIDEAILWGKRKQQPQFIMDGPYCQIVVYYEDTNGPGIFVCKIKDLEEIRDYEKNL